MLSLRGRALYLVGGVGSVLGSLLAIAAAAPRAATTHPSAPRLPVAAQALALVRNENAESTEAAFDPLAIKEEGGVLSADLGAGRRAELTLDPGLQAHVRDLLRRYAVPYAAFVALEPASGRVLAYVSHSSANPKAGDLVRDASAPSASVFKLVTAAALTDAGVAPDTRVCYGGGLHRLVAADIDDNERRDRACATLEQAIARSLNAVIAKLADRHLDRATLERYASAFGFGQSLSFDAPVPVSPMEVPDDRIERARTAAGFWHMHMSPLHAALIAATFANHGDMPRATMIRRVTDGEGHELPAPELPRARNVISAATAAAVGKMMLGTVTEGTSRIAFHDAHGRPYLPGIAIAGKTGSLNSDEPFRAYSWWVGFAPADAPEIALAALVVNTPEWRIKANQVARDALHYYLIERKTPPKKKAVTKSPGASAVPTAAPASTPAAPPSVGASQPSTSTAAGTARP